MANFFGRIRRKYLAGNKLSKYLMYASGEIILVVIGILIALWINNNNNESQLRILETKYLGEIKSNLEQDIQDIQFNIQFNEDKLKSNEIVLSYLNREIEYSDSLNFHFSNLLGSTRSIVNISGFQNLTSKGLEIVKTDSLRKRITEVYSTFYQNIIDFEFQDDHKHQYEILWPEVINAIEIESMWENAKPINKVEILNNYKLKNAISTNIFFRKYVLEKYKSLYENVTKLIGQIESELT